MGIDITLDEIYAHRHHFRRYKTYTYYKKNHPEGSNQARYIQNNPQAMTTPEKFPYQ